MQRAVFSVVLPPDAASAAEGRRLVRAALHQVGSGSVLDTAELLVSELVTNAVLHARTLVQVAVELGPSTVRIAVRDRSRDTAVRRSYGLRAGTGRGLALVETLSRAWGVERAEAPWTKGVWFELPVRAADLPAVPEGGVYGPDWLAMVDDL